ncbi:hypothetical protein OEZ86_003360 [Tetradesmus obliquus]|nr:hypothetical protein OEZ86_003360 [Tetradesmus obliquus]
MSPLFPTAPPTVTFSFQQTLTATLSYAKEFQYQEKAVAGIGIPFLTKATVEFFATQKFTTTETKTETRATTVTTALTQQIPALTAQTVPCKNKTTYSCGKVTTEDNTMILTTSGVLTGVDSDLRVTYGPQFPLSPPVVYEQADATCASNPVCSSYGLQGNCCPDDRGVYNGCCSFCALRPACQEYARDNTTMCCPSKTNVRNPCCDNSSSSSGAGSSAEAAAAGDRKLLVKILPDEQPKSVTFDNSLQLGSPDIKQSDPRITKKASGCILPEQVHITFWSATSVLVSWASCDAVLGTTQPPQPRPTAGVKSIVLYGTSPKKLRKTATGVATSYANDYSKSKRQGTYASPLLHHVLLTGLVPGQQYFYKVVGDNHIHSSSSSSSSSVDAATKKTPVTSKTFNFTVPRTGFPLRLGVLADPGQTYNTSEVLAGLIASKPQMLLMGGDFCYADNWMAPEQPITDRSIYYTFTYQPKWDTWGRLFEPLLSHVPFMHTHGNHEIEPLANGEHMNAYNHRFPVPQNGSAAPTKFTAVTAEDPFANLYHAAELPGVFKALFLTSYSPNQTFGKQEEQYKWLEQQLAQTDRTKTPWLIVVTHAPWYMSYKGHFRENECMREAYEPLLLKHKVDMVFSGHTHAYERTKPTAQYQVDECGPVYFTIGDGGNIEGLYKDFIDTVQPKPAWCADPEIGTQFPSYQPQKCITRIGEYCPSKQPAYSAYREPSFGFGSLDLINATHASWKWTKNVVPGWKVADQVTIVRGGNAACKSAQAAAAAATAKGL